MVNRLDIVIFGATGYTGKLLVKNAIHMCKDQNLKFGIAGRRKGALEAVIQEFASDNEIIPIILADVNDEESLHKMTKQTKILINCCGPYRFYGEPVVKACIATCTHYIDVTAEQQFMEHMQIKYNTAAKEAGVYIVCACGFDCIPTDLGIIFTQQQFEEVNSVEVYMKIWFTRCILPFIRPKGSYISYGTWDSAVHMLGHRNELQELHRKLYSNANLPELTPKLKSRGIHRSDVSEGWSMSVPSADRAVACRTQYFLHTKYNDRPAQIQFYATFKYFYEFLMIAIAGIFLLILSRLSCCRKLLLKHPALFTAGFISRKNSNLDENQKTVRFDTTIVAHGWTEKLAESNDQHTNPPNKKVIAKVSGESPYEMTSVVAILSAATILNEIDKIPDNGGVLTPGAAFGRTSLIEQMDKHNIKFEIISADVYNHKEIV